MIEINNVSFRHRGADKPVMTDFSAQFKKGEVVAVTGRNGCGKTTLTTLIVGINRPDSGSIIIDGSDTGGMDLFDIGQRVGYMFQNPDRQLFCETVYEEIAFGLKNQGLTEEEVRAKTEYCLREFALERYRDNYPGRLSTGEKQRLVLCAVLVLGSGYLVLDEPTTGLDMRSRRRLGEMLLELKTEHGIIIVSHERAFIDKYTDRELVME